MYILQIGSENMLFLGLLYEKQRENEILKLSKAGLSNAVNKFQWNVIDGLNENMDKPLEVINLLPVGTYPKSYKRLFLMTKKWNYESMINNIEIGTINIHFIKQFIRYKKVKKEIHNRMKLKDIDNILIYSTYLPFLKAINKLSNNVKVTLIVTDLPEFYDLAKVSLLKRILRRLNNIKVYRYLSRVDKFVLLTEEMKVPLNVGNRPYVVVEGLVNNKDIHCSYKESLMNDNNKKVILYTGTLHYKFGIENLLEAFLKIESKNYELWLCGSGEAENKIKQLSKKDIRIKFFGYLTASEIEKLQQRCTVLINPRQNEGEYTKYSFPSKTMEYMLSGKPVIMYKLDGIPDEYDDYLFYINGNKPEDLAEKIIEVCEKSEEEINQFGEKACKFVIENKNSRVQAQKILKVLDQK